MYIVSVYIEDIGKTVGGDFYREFSQASKQNKQNDVAQYTKRKEIDFMLVIREI